MQTITTETPLATWYDALGIDTPTECTSELLNEALEVMPPVYAAGCFGVGEAYSHTNEGIPVRHWFAEIGGKSYGILQTKFGAVEAFKKLRAEVTK